MHLAQLFLRTLSTDYSEENTIRAFKNCEREWKQRIHRNRKIQEEISLILNSGKISENFEKTELFHEISSFGEVIRDSLEDVEVDFEIIRLAKIFERVREEEGYYKKFHRKI